MQRRAATVYAVLFLVIAAGAYSLIGVAEQPDIELEGETYAENETLEVNGFEYTVASAGSDEGSLTRVNESSLYVETLDNDSTVELNNNTYRVSIPDTSDPSEFTLRQEYELGENVTTTEQEDTVYVIVDGDNENRTLVPREEYVIQQFGERDIQEFTEGETFDFKGNETTVSNVTAESAVLQYTSPRTLQTTISEGSTVELGPEDNSVTYVPHFPGDGVVQFTTDVEEYNNQVEQVDDFNEGVAGLWGIVILSGITITLLLGMAFLPNK